MEQIILLEYNEKEGCFHYNLMQYVSATRGYKAVSLCSYELASEFTVKFRDAGVSYDEVCMEWESFFMSKRVEFEKIGLR